MTQQEIQERNKQIALMLGWECQSTKTKYSYWKLPNNERYFCDYEFPKHDKNFIFHSNWNWLMEAVEFIQQKYSTIISHNHCEIHMYDNGKRPINIGSNTTMFATFIAVSDFAKLYNNKEL